MIQGIQHQMPVLTEKISNTGTVKEAHGQFSTFLKESLNQVNNAQKASDLATEKLARGEKIDLHNVMIVSQKASIAMQTTIEIRNKAVEAYQEMMRMQM
ncbi:flagellar hook-basal body protein FliE [Bacillus sp. VT 712]|jgi:flagellar hook-basal body complex protein FliE|uniref:Flagellar hook-basal body complex protein FliE n=3 Tax=Priestia TaxID=2800373 RepID=A0A0V8JRI8_9BACI|nr:flagellar hook-basal body complex protein FliE [Priestia flexa]KSU89668.1 flagellar hook-basal body protein FliE [Priestia veravalensis]KZB93274.1 flagellar hook-basal body protein FliE [Bacillus sp. VT 712]MBN8250089.1 flagellar hook-basal body complex protein FliE [Priestia flexa]MBN8434588.1 flagellar hook-basal body complex protein FliE [Priestia flexa]